MIKSERGMIESEHDVADVLAGFAATVNAAGVDVGPGRLRQFVRAVALLDSGARADVRIAARCTLCSSPADLRVVERAMQAVFDGDLPVADPAPPVPADVLVAAADEGDRDDDSSAGDDEDVVTEATVSRLEVLRHRDFAEMDGQERRDLARLMATIDLVGDVRRTRRYAPARRGEVDARATMREMRRSAGEPVRLRRRARRTRPRRVILLVDISGSMTAYSDALLRFAHAASRRRTNGAASARTEVFTLGTRLTRVTGELCGRDPDRAMSAVGAAVGDWSGGTRLGELLEQFLQQWGRRGMARGAVVVVLSDGWECGDPHLLGEQMAHLSRLAHRVVWANPRKGRPGYRPLVGGMRVSLPYVDDFVEGHTIDALERLARVIALGSDPTTTVHAEQRMFV